MARFRLTRAAADDLAAIFLDGLEQSSLPQADAYHEGLGVVFAFLANHPHTARLREDILPPVRVGLPPERSLILMESLPTTSSRCMRKSNFTEAWNIGRT